MLTKENTVQRWKQSQTSARGALHYERSGHGEPLLLLHGIGSGLRVWDPVLPWLAPYHEVIAVDLPGHGESPLLDDGTAPDAAGFARVLADFMDQLPALLAAANPGRNREGVPAPVAYHPPCTLQHGQQVRGKVEGVLRAAGVAVAPCADSHLCCGAAGTYSVLHPALAHELRDRKLAALHATGAGHIVSANVGCIAHLQGGTATPVTHWIEVLDAMLVNTAGDA